ncbi:cupin domain-containing protein [Alicyclobacillus sp. ALC3]|uniref:cupin domain-containing protein n=1 Tax=Alicyclobacillus sp. ALC3 TaxID=2796143 RepID=UPI002378BA6D|nr:cupin domain-containing protein [Alicyclobacillus sp. ALC3]WDL96678.1 cupin domain-containing protein [Alicyclobacillus sp. ALC3]
MKIFRFDTEVGHQLTAFGSHDVVLSRILRTTDRVQIGCIRVQPDGVIALHKAVGPQLMLVVQGEGWVRGREDSRTPVHAGQAVYWKDGEWHETGSESGLTAIVVEGAALEPERVMPEVDPNGEGEGT